MKIYKQAIREKLRFQTSVGVLALEQLWDLEPEQLDAIALSLESEYKQSGAKSFLTKKSKKDKTAKLKFDIVIDILNTKVREESAATVAKANKEHNDKIYALMARNDQKELRKLSNEELKEQLKEE